jgi:hypothetical protein
VLERIKVILEAAGGHLARQRIDRHHAPDEARVEITVTACIPD